LNIQLQREFEGQKVFLAPEAKTFYSTLVILEKSEETFYTKQVKGSEILTL
jgi:hypothetical protein